MGAGVAVDGLGDELTAVGLPIGAALVLVILPVQLAVGVVPLARRARPAGLLGSDVDAAALVGRLVDPIRAVVGLGVVLLAFRAARRVAPPGPWSSAPSGSCSSCWPGPSCRGRRPGPGSTPTC